MPAHKGDFTTTRLTETGRATGVPNVGTVGFVAFRHARPDGRFQPSGGLGIPGLLPP